MSTQERIDGLEATIAELRSENANLRRYLELYEATDTLVAERGAIPAIRDITKERDSLRAELETLREDITILKNSTKLLNAANASEISALRAENARLREDLKKANLSWVRCSTLEGILISERKNNAQLTARIAELEGALREIIELKPSPFELPADWKEQIAKCPECQGWAKNHPIQQGICDLHRQPLYRREAHEAHEERAIGCRPQLIATKALNQPRE